MKRRVRGAEITTDNCGSCRSFLKSFGLGLFGAFGVDHVREGTKKIKTI